MSVNQTVDEELIGAAMAGDGLAQAKLYETFQPIVLGYLIRLTGSVALAEDLCQDSFIKAFKAIKQYRGEASFKNWLFMIVKHRLADHWKGHYRRNEVSLEDWLGKNDVPFELTPIEKSEAEDQMRKLLEQLPSDYRTILEYRFLRGYSIKETAAALNISETNAKVRQFRAMQQAKQIAQTYD